MGATLSILGLYNYDPSIFDGFTVPAGMVRDDVRDAILIECAELEILFPQPATMKMAISLWSKSRLPQWEKLYTTTVIEYNPIENYNRQETWSDSENGSSTTTATKRTTGNDTQETSLQGSNNTTTTENTSNSVVGFNGATGGGVGESLKDKQDVAGSSTATTTGSNTGTTTIDRTESDNGSGSHDKTASHSGTVKGNIGVTTTQQMLAEERKISAFNMVDYIVRDFKQRFCIMVY